MAKKKIKDLTIEECKKICSKSSDEFSCYGKCPLLTLCYTYQDSNFNIPNEYLEQEVEVEL